MLNNKTKENQKGATAVELAIVIPLLVLLIFGIIEFSLLLYNKAMITNAAREGARYGIVWAPEGYTIEQNDIEDVVINYLGNNLISFSPNIEENLLVVTNDACVGPETEYTLNVTVDYRYYFLVLPIGSVLLSSEANMRCETILTD